MIRKSLLSHGHMTYNDVVLTSMRRRYAVILAPVAHRGKCPKMRWFGLHNAAMHKKDEAATVVGWLVVLGLTALCDSISVYIGPSPKEREQEERKER